MYSFKLKITKIAPIIAFNQSLNKRCQKQLTIMPQTSKTQQLSTANSIPRRAAHALPLETKTGP